MDKAQPFLETERENTNNSLSAERDKTNESLSEVRAQTEVTTDEVVTAERLLADKLTTSSRTEADAARKVKHMSLDTEDKAKQDAKQLHNERRSADQVTEQERARTDAALIKERKTNDALVNRFLEHEREKTDKNLSVERNRTDSHVEEKSTLLSDEIAEHLKTKTSLTSRDEFLAIVSHDLKNPIGAASSCASLLLTDATYKDLTPDVRALLQLIKRNSDTALRLIGDLLDMERVAEGKLQIHFSQHEIGQILRDCLESHVQLAAEKKILLQLTPADIKGEIVCDCDRIAQVISNLLNNAIKFTPEGGSITMNATFSGTELLVSVRDTGPGIPDNMKEKIFDRFMQISSNDRRGLGLGLHIAKMLVDSHQGKLWVESKMGEGSVFFFSLPLHRPTRQPGPH